MGFSEESESKMDEEPLDNKESEMLISNAPNRNRDRSDDDMKSLDLSELLEKDLTEETF